MSTRLDKYQNTPQHYREDRCVYPIMTHFDGFRTVADPQGKGQKKCFALCNKVRERPIELKKLSPRDQQKFFKLDCQYEEAFVNQHQGKVGVKTDPLRKALLANLKNDRVRVFKQFVADVKQ